MKAVKKAEAMRVDRSYKCNIVVVEDGEEKDLSKDELKLFESRLPLKDKLKKMIMSEVVSDDLVFERQLAAYVKLYK